MPGTTETLWTGFNGRKVGAERAIKDETGRNIAAALDMRVEGIASTDYPDAPTKIVVLARANLPDAAHRDPNTIYLVKEAT